MIAKGASRSGARQLAVYLMRVERWDTGEPAELLELRSPWAASIDGEDRHHTADQASIEAFRDWQTLVEGTKQGRDGLYHAEISPEAHYARDMTPEQWKRAADILGEELGLKEQPCAMVLHAGKDDRPHLHVVWQRTDVDTMKVISDSYNYIAHERASQRMELEFGQKMIPGKHAKRDRKKQKDFPRSQANHADHQQAERTPLTVEQRKEQITALRAAADTAQAFKGALEDAGFVLAKGDKRGFVLVDREGEVYSLSKQVQDIKGKEFKAFMSSLDPEKLPSVEAFAAAPSPEQQTITAPKPEPAPEEAQKQGVEASKFVPSKDAPKAPEPPPAPKDEEFERLKKALAERQAEDLKKWDLWHAQELRQKQFELDKEMNAKLTLRQADELKALNDLKESIRERTTGIKGVIAAIENRWNPGLGAERAKQRRNEIAQLKRRQEKERKDYIALIEQTKQLEIENLKERQALQRRDQQQKHIEEEGRYARDREQALRLRAEVEADRMKRERTDNLREGPPPPKLGK